MDFELSEEQREILRAVNTFAVKEIAPAQEEMVKTHEFPYELWNKWAELGMCGILVPEEYGGTDLDTLTYILIMEEVARFSQAFCLIWQVHVLISEMFLKFGTEEQKNTWLPKIVTGEILCAIAMTEPGAGSDVRGMKTKAVLDGDEWVLNGTKTFISSAGTDISDGMILMAVTGIGEDGRNEISSFIIPRDAPGFELGQSWEKMAWEGMDNRELIFNDCRLPKDCLLGEIGHGIKHAMSGMALGRIVFGALGTGLMQDCLDTALEYAKERKQFGKPIASFQLIQAMLANMAIHTTAARQLTRYAAWLHSQGLPCTTEAAMAKYFATHMATKTAQDAYQIHGGYGFMKEYKVNRLVRESQVLEIGEGTNQIMQLYIASQMGC